MIEAAKYTEDLIRQDPGGRGLAAWGIRGGLASAVASLYEGRHILLTTGFYIPDAGAIETDGPPGAIILGEALIRSGKKVTLIVDGHSEKIMRQGLSYSGTDIPLTLLPAGGGFDLFSLLTDETTHFIALERPGRAVDGNYYNFRGKNITRFHTGLDDLFAGCTSRGVVTIGIGDGGNELGMGAVAKGVDSFLPFDRPFSCRTGAAHTICAGVSNWAGYGAAALLSLLSGKNLMISPDKLKRLMDAIVLAGAVDGVTGKREATVDGLEPGMEFEIYRKLYNMASRAADAA